MKSYNESKLIVIKDKERWNLTPRVNQNLTPRVNQMALKLSQLTSLGHTGICNFMN